MTGEWSTPDRPEAQLWLAEFNEHYRAWLEAGLTDPAAAGGLVDALQNLLERSPEDGVLVAGLATTLLHQGSAELGPPLASRLAGVGLTAGRLVPDPDPLTLAWLTVERGLAGLADGRLLDAARDGLAAIGTLDREAAGQEELQTFLCARAHALRALALDALLDYGQAEEQYRRVEELAAGYSEAGEQLQQLLLEVVMFLYGTAPTEAAGAELQLLWGELASLRIGAAAGRARCTAFTDPDDLGAALVQAATVFREHGLGALSPLELTAAVHLADPPAAAAFVEDVVTLAGELDLRSEDWTAVLFAAAAFGASDAAGLERATSASETALAEVDDLMHAAVACGFLYASQVRAGAESAEAQTAFLDLVELLAWTRDERLDDPRLRAAFDEPVATVLGALADAVAEEPLSPRRIQLARLIDFDLGGRTPLDRWLPTERPPEAATELQLAEALLGDRIARLQQALRRWPGATALILRSAGASSLVFCMSADGDASVSDLGGPYEAAAEELASYLADEIAALELTGTAPVDQAGFVDRGEAAYRALPESVRAKVEASDVLLVCADYRTGGDTIPFELFRGESDWLGTEKVVARFPSLRALVHSAEATARRDSHRRLLALAVPDPPGYPPLTFAQEEATAVRELLDELGWDAPAIDAPRVTPSFVTDRLPYATHLHLVAHGEADGVEDALLLADGERLSSTDLAARFFPRAPTAYVNACSLALTRWAGGGKSRGVAQGLLEAGSPAVIANLLPVDDDRSSEIAGAFYREAEAGTFGDALRAARSGAKAGMPPLFWASTVLLGDPRTTLTPSETERSLSEQLLDTMLAGEEGTENEEIRSRADKALASDHGDLRLAAAAALLREIASWGESITRDLRPRIADACRVAAELDHLPAAAMTAFLLAETYDEDDDPNEALRVLEGVIELFEPLEQDSQLWKSLLDRVLTRWMLLRAGERAPTVNVSGAAESEADELLRVGEALRDAQLAIDARALRRGHASAAREAERSAADVLWNAVQANRELQLESMPEVRSFADQVAEKLIRAGELGEDAQPRAGCAISGLLKWLWDSQNVAALPREMADGQAGTLAELVRSLRENWPPAEAPWFELVGGLPEEIRAELAALVGLPYDDALYPAIDAAMERIEALARDSLAAVAEKHPERQPDAMAWALGVLIECNTFSWTEGSVPESKQERLTSLFYSIGSDAESAFSPWLFVGFQSVREAELDELERWRLGLPQPA